MPNDITIVAKSSHQRLVADLLPKALNVIERTLDVDPYEEVLDKDGQPTGVKKFNGRVNGQALRAAVATASLVERLGDQALRRQAGNQMKKLLAAIKQRDPDALKRIGPPTLQAQTAATEEPAPADG